MRPEVKQDPKDYAHMTSSALAGAWARTPGAIIIKGIAANFGGGHASCGVYVPIGNEFYHVQNWKNGKGADLYEKAFFSYKEYSDPNTVTVLVKKDADLYNDPPLILALYKEGARKINLP